MQPIFYSRPARRSTLFISFIIAIVLLAAYTRRTRKYIYRDPYKTRPQRVAHTVTRTQWMRATQTVYLDRGQSRNGKDEIGTRSLAKHTYRPDGLLEVNPEGPHPIFKLIKDAEMAWEDKHRKASKTLEEAVKEYKRRYRRDPPRGFDHWWNYVQEHRVQLPDEYDQIHRDLEPFWGMDPRDLQHIQRDWEAHADSYTIGKDKIEDSIKLLNYTLPGNDKVRYDLAKGAFEIMELLEEVDRFLPPFRAVFSPHDNPNLFTDWELKQMALEAARNGKFIDINNPPPVKLDGWISACAPDSPAYKKSIDLNPSSPPPPPQTSKTFIHNHRLTMDPCNHPEILRLSGQFLSHNKGPVPHRMMIPQFSYCPTTLHHDIMPAMPINWVRDITPRSDDPEWDDKVDDRLHWRGRNTGIWHAHDTQWRMAQRIRLVDLAVKSYEQNISVLRARSDELSRVGGPVKIKKGRYAPALFDVAFVDGPISCEDHMCHELQKIFEFRMPHDASMTGRYKYIMDVDGNGWSSRFKRLITSNSLIFKSTIYPEWFTDRIEPWVHYVPIQSDFSDLFDVLLFFRGEFLNPDDTELALDSESDLETAEFNARWSNHEDLAKKIAKAGREWSLNYWRREDLTAYMFRLFLEYARVMSTDRDRNRFKL
ncbi:hypothetical protein APHAL10511_005211 [Amanita phalloides]|nr:hypothetical protein APHAL10511_005211 [Amanita phalloides]